MLSIGKYCVKCAVIASAMSVSCKEAVLLNLGKTGGMSINFYILDKTSTALLMLPPHNLLSSHSKFFSSNLRKEILATRRRGGKGVAASLTSTPF